MSQATLDKLDHAALVREVVEIRDRCDRMLDILLPDGVAGGCPHPPALVEHECTMDDSPESFRCTRCGTTSPIPFHITPEDKE